LNQQQPSPTPLLLGAIDSKLENRIRRDLPQQGGPEPNMLEKPINKVHKPEQSSNITFDNPDLFTNNMQHPQNGLGVGYPINNALIHPNHNWQEQKNVMPYDPRPQMLEINVDRMRLSGNNFNQKRI
jgi:hypothetical protein